MKSNIVELNPQELEEINGGVAPIVLVLVAAGGLAAGLCVGVGVCYLAYKYL